MKPSILFLAANPLDTGRLALDQECAAIERELRMTPHHGDFAFHSKWAVGIHDLTRCLIELSPTVLHFSGHGTPGTGFGASSSRAHSATRRDLEPSQGAGIVLQDGDSAQHVSERALAEMIRSTSPATRLVVLNACYSAASASSLSSAVDCVVGMDGAIEDAAARTFAKAFYRGLGNRCSVANAVDQARACLVATQQAHHLPEVRTRSGVRADQIYLTPADPLDAPTKPQVVPDQAGIDNASSPQARPADGYTYDLFLAHPPAARPTAGALYDLLQADTRVFLAARSLRPSEHWDQDVVRSQQASRTTVLLLSPQAEASWHLNQEVLSAIAAHRDSPRAQVLAAVLLDPRSTVPRSLLDVPMVDASAVGGLDGVAAWLRQQVAEYRRSEPSPMSTSSYRNRLTSSGSQARGDLGRLYERLCRLAEATFENVVSDAGIPRDAVALPTTAIAVRALDVAQLAALDRSLSSRVAAALDKHALWTRPR